MRSMWAIPLLLMPVAAVAAGPVCDARSTVVNHLMERYEELPSGLGLMTDGNLLEILTSERGTWTLLISRPDGASCAVAVGDRWQSFLPRGGPENRASLDE